MKELETIIRYKMDSAESKAYKIALMWEDECRRELPGESWVRLNRKADPRKSSLFKYCFKLARETKGIIPDSEIQMYVRAQIQVLKSIRHGEVHALVEPHCLVGDKAWRRWKFWKYRHDRKLGVIPTSGEMHIRTPEGKIKAEIASSLDFLTKMGCTEFDELESRREDFQRWHRCGEVSSFYVVMSPWVRKIFGDPSNLGFDHSYYRASITPSAEEYFRESFMHEFEGKNECQRA
jgi:hypothetical protein